MFFWILAVLQCLALTFTVVNGSGCLAKDRNANSLYGVSGDKLYLTPDTGGQFTVLLSEAYVGNVVCDSTGRYVLVLAETSKQYLFSSNDFGKSWKKTPNFLGSTCTNCLIATNGQHVFMSTPSEYGSNYMSNDFGQTWTSVAKTATISALSMSDVGSKLIKLESSQLYFSQDYGGSFYLHTGITNVVAFAADATGDRILVLLSSGGCALTTDRGQIWSSVSIPAFAGSTCGVSSISVVMDGSGKYQMVYCHDTASVSFLISSDFGVTWISRSVPDSVQQFVIEDVRGVARVPKLYKYTYRPYMSNPYRGSLRPAVSYDLGETWSYNARCFPNSESRGSSSLCYPCERDTENPDGVGSCTECPFGERSSGETLDCANPCSWPTAYKDVAEDFCAAYYINAPAFALYAVYGLYGFFYVVAMITIFLSGDLPWKQVSAIDALSVVATLTLPCVDVVTDLLYVLQSKFYERKYLIMVGFFYVFPLFTFLYELWSKALLPSFHILHIPNCIWNLFEKADNLGKVVCMALLCLPFFLVNMVWMAPMVFLGFIMQATCLYSVRSLRRLWLRVWTGMVPEEEDLIVDVKHFNKMALRESVLESFPQLIVQTMNTLYVNEFTLLDLISIGVSFLSVTNALYRAFYYCVLLGFKVDEVPTPLAKLVISDATRKNAEDEHPSGVVASGGKVVMVDNGRESFAEHEDEVDLKSFELTSMRVRLAESNTEEIQTLKRDVESIRLGMTSMESRLDEVLHWIGRDIRKPSSLESHLFGGLRSSSYRPLPATDAVEESDIETNSDRAISARKVVPE